MGSVPICLTDVGDKFELLVTTNYFKLSPTYNNSEFSEPNLKKRAEKRRAKAMLAAAGLGIREMSRASDHRANAFARAEEDAEGGDSGPV